jgi:hypothetical protein
MGRLLLMVGLLLGAVGAEPVTQSLEGRLVVPAEAGTKSSYFTGNFQLLTRDARLLVIPSKQVSEEQMTAFRDQLVRLKVISIPEQQADPDEQAPMEMGPDGRPVLKAHPACYRVIEIKAYRGAPFPVLKP